VDGLEILKLAQEAGLSVTLDSNGETLLVRGQKSKSSDSVLKYIRENKPEVIGALKMEPEMQYSLLPDRSREIESIKDRMRKGIDWFVSVDSKLWDANDMPITGKWIRKQGEPSIHSPTRLEKQFTHSLEFWLELDKTLRNAYEYEDCIFDSGSCPEDSIVKCMGCE
tara:strand:+ start:10361 stop:10861 length:501 start_codon:yes stop_codon:yes gene_type:complete